MKLYSDNEAAFDKQINEIETFLSTISVCPGVGSVAGAGKILMGITQTLAAIAYGILFAISDLTSRNPLHVNRAWTHIKHGLGNIAAGAIESIPIIQTAFYLIRQRCKTHSLHYSEDDKDVHVSTGYDDKFMPYQSLVEREWGIVGENEETLKAVNEIFQEDLKIQTIEHSRKNNYQTEKKFLSTVKKIKIAQEAIDFEKWLRNRNLNEKVSEFTSEALKYHMCRFDKEQKRKNAASQFPV